MRERKGKETNFKQTGGVLSIPKPSQKHVTDQSSAHRVSDIPHLLYLATPEIASITGHSL